MPGSQVVTAVTGVEWKGFQFSSVSEGLIFVGAGLAICRVCTVAPTSGKHDRDLCLQPPSHTHSKWGPLLFA